MTSSTVSQKKINNLICSDCNKTFKHPNSIYNHRKTCKKNIELCIEIEVIKDDSKEKKRKYKLEKVNCDVCSKSVSKGNLSTHKKVHQNITKNNIAVKPLVKPMVYQKGVRPFEKKKEMPEGISFFASLEETFNFLCWLSKSQKYTINTLEEFQDSFIIFTNNNSRDDENEPSPKTDENESSPKTDENEPSPKTDENESSPKTDENESSPKTPDMQIKDEENITISIAECNLLNIFEEDEELENYNDEYSYFEKSKKNDKQIYNLIRANTSQHYFFKINKFLKRYEKSNLINYDIDGLNTCTNSIIKIKKSLQILMRLSDDEIYNDNLSNFIKETIDNNFISRTLLAGLKIKYNELEYEDESWNKYEFIRTIYDSLNDMMEQVLKIWDKKCKKIIKR
jgi:hypothetical protein